MIGCESPNGAINGCSPQWVQSPMDGRAKGRGGILAFVCAQSLSVTTEYGDNIIVNSALLYLAFVPSSGMCFVNW